MASGEGLQIHPRYWNVAKARNGFAMEICRILDRHRRITINAVTENLLKIALATNAAVGPKKRKEPELDKVGKEIYEALVAQEKAQELTFNESVLVLFDALESNHKYAMRHERHPEDPDRKFDEA